MNTIRRMISLLVCIALALSLAACGDKQEGTPNSSSSTVRGEVEYTYDDIAGLVSGVEDVYVYQGAVYVISTEVTVETEDASGGDNQAETTVEALILDNIRYEEAIIHGVAVDTTEVDESVCAAYQITYDVTAGKESLDAYLAGTMVLDDEATYVQSDSEVHIIVERTATIVAYADVASLVDEGVLVLGLDTNAYASAVATVGTSNGDANAPEAVDSTNESDPSESQGQESGPSENENNSDTGNAGNSGSTGTDNNSGNSDSDNKAGSTGSGNGTGKTGSTGNSGSTGTGNSGNSGSGSTGNNSGSTGNGTGSGTGKTGSTGNSGSGTGSTGSGSGSGTGGSGTGKTGSTGNSGSGSGSTGSGTGKTGSTGNSGSGTGSTGNNSGSTGSGTGSTGSGSGTGKTGTDNNSGSTGTGDSGNSGTGTGSTGSTGTGTGSGSGSNSGSTGTGSDSNSGSGSNSGSTGSNSGSTGTGTVAHTHSYTSKVTKAATCATDGVRTYTCSCGDTYTEVIPATGKHTWVEQTKEVWVEDDPVWVVDEAAHTEEEIVDWDEYYICNGCGAKFEDSHDAADHLAVCPTPTGGYSYVAKPIYKTVRYAEVGHYEETGHYKTVVTGYVCSECGATKKP